MSWTEVAAGARSLLGGSDFRKARIAEAELAHEVAPNLAAFIAGHRPAASSILVGSVGGERGSRKGIHLSLSDLATGRTHLTGASGSGKSMWLLGLILQVLRAENPPGLVLSDMKGELAGWMTDIWLPLMAERLQGDEREAFLKRVVVINPFGRKYLPELQVLKPDPAIPIRVQANELLDLFEDTVGELGARMSAVLRKLFLLGISTGLSFPDLPRALANPALRHSLVERCSLPDVRDYFLFRFGKENETSIQALESRLDAFLALPETRLVLGAAGCVDFAKILEETVTVIDLGSPPLGSERTAKFWASLILGKLTRAIMSREVSEETPPVWLVVDEWQETLVPSQVGIFERLLTQARFKRCGIVLANQGSEQLAGAPALRKIVETNSTLRVAFRAGAEDARALAPYLPSPEGASTALHDSVAGLARLPDRVFVMHEKTKPWGAQILVSPTLQGPAEARRRAHKVPDEIRERIKRGRYGKTREELMPRGREDETKPVAIAEEGTELVGDIPRIDDVVVVTPGAEPVSLKERHGKKLTRAQEKAVQKHLKKWGPFLG